MQKLPQLLALPERAPTLTVVAGSKPQSALRRREGLSPSLAAILEEVLRELGTEIDADGSSKFPDHAEVERIIKRCAEKGGLELSHIERDELIEYVEKEQKPFGILQELVDDTSVSDIIVTHSGRICVQQGRRNFATDLAFASREAYEAYVEKLLQRAGSTYSTKKPIADGMIGSSARVHVVHACLCESGPYLTIRLNRFSTVTNEDLLRTGTAPREVLDYLRGIVNAGQTVLTVGEVGTGKTTLVRALAGTIPAEESILVIEDTPEIRLEHPHVRYVTTREANSDGAGRVTPSECIRAGMRMAMNRIIFGEIRDAEAAEAFIDVCASGHAGLSTIHARSALEALTRLELFLGRAQRGVDRSVISEQIVTAVQVVVFLNICPLSGRRRVMEIFEIGPVADGVIRHREMFRYQIQHGTPQWKVVSKVSAHREALESLASPVQLSSLSAVIELGAEEALRESSESHRLWRAV